MIDPVVHIDLTHRREAELAREAAAYGLARSLRPERERLVKRLARLARRRFEGHRPPPRGVPASAG
jgi:hypothetical protein